MIKRILKSKWLETLILFFFVVLFFFLYKIPNVIWKFLIHICTLKSLRLSITYEDCCRYDPRSWYIQYYDKGFSFIFTKYVHLSIKNKKRNVNVLRRFYIYRNRWLLFSFFKTNFDRLFINQKIQLLYLIYLIFSLFYFIFIKRKLLLYIYMLILLILRLIFGKLIIFLYTDEELLATDYLMKVFNYFFYSNIFVFTSLKIEILKRSKYFEKIIIFTKAKLNLIVKYTYRLLIFLYKIFMIKFYNIYYKFISMKNSRKSKVKFNIIYNKIDKYRIILWMINNNLLQKKQITIKIFNFGLKLILRFMFEKNKKIKKRVGSLIGKDLFYWYGVFKIYNSFDFLTSKNIGHNNFSKFRFYKEWFTYNFYIAYINAAKRLFKYFLETEINIIFNYNGLDLFWRGDNYMYSLLNEYSYIWESDYNLEFRISDWGLTKVPLKEFFNSALLKEKIKLFSKRFVIRYNKGLFDKLMFKNESLFYFKDFTNLKKKIWLVYDSNIGYIKRNFMMEAGLTKDLKKIVKINLNNKKFDVIMEISVLIKILYVLLKEKKLYKEEDKIDIINSIKFDLELNSDWYSTSAVSDYIIDINKYGKKELRKSKIRIIKRLERSSYYETILKSFHWVKKIGLKFFDIESYLEKKINKQANKYETIINKKIKEGNIITKERKSLMFSKFELSKTFIIYNKLFEKIGFIYEEKKIKKNIKYIKILKKIFNTNVLNIFFTLFLLILKNKKKRQILNGYYLFRYYLLKKRKKENVKKE